jgi:hypothetical protein
MQRRVLDVVRASDGGLSVYALTLRLCGHNCCVLQRAIGKPVDRVSDPGNAGNVRRAVRALVRRGVICVEPYDFERRGGWFVSLCDSNRNESLTASPS